MHSDDESGRRTSSIHLLHAITRTANEAISIDAALAESVALIAEFMRWPVGHAYRRDPTSGRLVSTSVWSTNTPAAESFRRSSEGLQFAPGEGLPGHVLLTGNPVWVADVTADSRFARFAEARDAQLKSGMCFPVVAGKDIVAVLEFFSPEPHEPEQGLMELMSDVGIQLGRVMERAHSAETLQQYVSEVDDLYNNAPAGYHSLDKSGMFLRINDTELRWLGYRRDEVVGKMAITRMLTPAGVKTFEKNFPLLRQEGTIQDVEFEFVRKNGSRFPVLLSATSIRDQSGNFVMSRSVVYDISDRKRLENELRESEERFRQIFQQAPLGVGLFSRHGSPRFLIVNPRLARLTGYAAEELSQMSLDDITHPDDRGNDRAMMGALFRGEIPAFTFEKRLVDRTGMMLWGNVVTTAIRNAEGDITCGLAIIEDITQRKHIDGELRRVVDELEEALANVKTLRGLLPICAWCRKMIKDDEGRWNDVESYLKDHTAAEFTHGICPDCAKKYQPR
jgi:PAS domain S-box-containing protein